MERNRKNDRQRDGDQEQDARYRKHHEGKRQVVHQRPPLGHVERAVERVGETHKEILPRPQEEDQRDDARDAASVNVRCQIVYDVVVQRRRERVEERHGSMLRLGKHEGYRTQRQHAQRKEREDGVECNRLRVKGAPVASETDDGFAKRRDESMHSKRYIVGSAAIPTGGSGRRVDRRTSRRRLRTSVPGGRTRLCARRTVADVPCRPDMA